jgi:hypothetical protein
VGRASRARSWGMRSGHLMPASRREALGSLVRTLSRPRSRQTLGQRRAAHHGRSWLRHRLAQHTCLPPGNPPLSRTRARRPPRNPRHHSPLRTSPSLLQARPRDSRPLQRSNSSAYTPARRKYHLRHKYVRLRTPHRKCRVAWPLLDTKRRTRSKRRIRRQQTRHQAGSGSTLRHCCSSVRSSKSSWSSSQQDMRRHPWRMSTLPPQDRLRQLRASFGPCSR